MKGWQGGQERMEAVGRGADVEGTRAVELSGREWAEEGSLLALKG